jgi:hypothetical protein
MGLAARLRPIVSPLRGSEIGCFIAVRGLTPPGYYLPPLRGSEVAQFSVFPRKKNEEVQETAGIKRW